VLLTHSLPDKAGGTRFGLFFRSTRKSDGRPIGRRRCRLPGREAGNYTFNCPITKKPTAMRDVETITGPHSKTLEMFGADPKTGKEYKMMRIELTKK